MSQAWMIVSGKGGVGKSMVTSALGIALSTRQMQTCCVDTDMGLRNLDMLLNMHNKVVYDALDVVHKDCKLKYALIHHTQYEGLSLLPASQLGDVTEMKADDVTKIVKKLKKHAAYVLLDAPAGLGRGIENLIPSADHAILVTTGDDIALRDAEKVIKRLEAAGKPRPMLIVNRVVPKLVKAEEMYDPQEAADKLDVPLLGYVPEDYAVLSAVNRHESFMEIDCPASLAMKRIAQRFLGEVVPMPPVAKCQRMWLRGFGKKNK